MSRFHVLMATKYLDLNQKIYKKKLLRFKSAKNLTTIEQEFILIYIHIVKMYAYVYIPPINTLFKRKYQEHKGQKAAFFFQSALFFILNKNIYTIYELQDINTLQTVF